MKKLSLLPLGFLIVMLGVSLALSLSAFVTVTNRGVVKAVGISIYEDEDCTAPLTAIDWGIVYPSSNVTFEAWLRNEGNVPVNINMTLENWSPSYAEHCMSLTWNGSTVNKDKIVPVIFNLQIFENATNVEEFRFDILLVGNEV